MCDESQVRHKYKQSIVHRIGVNIRLVEEALSDLAQKPLQIYKNCLPFFPDTTLPNKHKQQLLKRIRTIRFTTRANPAEPTGLNESQVYEPDDLLLPLSPHVQVLRRC